jgi:Protein of unknown function (DUF3108)
MKRIFSEFLLALPFSVVLAGVGAGQQLAVRMPPGRAARPDVPFGVGEQSVYDLKFRSVKVGSGRMEITGIERIRGRAAYHIVFEVTGGIPGFKVDDSYESWVDTASLASLRHVQRVHEGGYHRETTYEIFPERKSYSENGGSEKPGVSNPLDDGSFVYFARTVTLAAGERQVFQRYFKADMNPVVLAAERIESIDVPAGTFEALVVRPSIKSGGMFGEGGEAEIWLSTDKRKLLLELKTKMSIGSLNLYLRSYRPPQEPVAAGAR